MNDRNILIAGAAGQGLQSISSILGQTLLRLGYYVFVSQDFMSRVRGGHNFAKIRFSDQPLGAEIRRLDWLLALNQESLELHLTELEPQGLALCMAEDKGEIDDPRIRALPKEIGPAAAKRAQYAGIKLQAMLLTMLGIGTQPLIAAFTAQFGKKLTPEVMKLNLAAIEAAAAFVDPHDIKIIPFSPSSPAGRILVSGNEGLALGMIAAGIGIYSSYPISPASSLMDVLAANGPQLGIAVEQAEDEIAALNIALGASYAGARAAAGSSGPGMSLMSETLSLAGVTETPIVIIDAQRPGPATGMATRTEQSDLLMMVHAGHGEFPRAVLAPANHDDAFYMAAEAFNLADRWQAPVIIMSDQNLADSQRVIPEYDVSHVKIDRGPLAEEPSEPDYLPRYRITDNGVSPRAFPILSKWLVAADSHEHDEIGHLTDDLENRKRQNKKRMKKLEGLAAEFSGPEIFGPATGTLLLCWGSTAGPVLEAVQILLDRGHQLGVAVFRHLFPMNVEKNKSALQSAKRLITIEGNLMGQLGRLLRMETGIMTDDHIGKADGRPFAVEDVVALVEAKLGGSS